MGKHRDVLANVARAGKCVFEAGACGLADHLIEKGRAKKRAAQQMTEREEELERRFAQLKLTSLGVETGAQELKAQKQVFAATQAEKQKKIDVQTADVIKKQKELGTFETELMVSKSRLATDRALLDIDLEGLADKKHAFAAEQAGQQRRIDAQAADVAQRRQDLTTAEANVKTSRERLATDQALLKTGKKLLSQKQAGFNMLQAAQDKELVRQQRRVEIREQQCADAKGKVQNGEARLKQAQKELQALEAETVAQKAAVLERENACRDHEQALQKTTKEVAAAEAALVLKKEEAAKDQAVLVQDRQRLVDDQVAHRDLIAAYEDEMTSREDAVLASEEELGRTANSLRTKAASVSDAMAASGIMWRVLHSDQINLNADKAAFNSYKLQTTADLKNDKLGFEAYQKHADAKLKIQSQAATARAHRLSRVEVALKTKQTALTGFEVKLNKRADDLAKGEEAKRVADILEDHRAAKLAAEARFAKIMAEQKVAAHEARVASREAALEAKLAEFQSREIMLHAKAAELANGQDALRAEQAAFSLHEKQTSDNIKAEEEAAKARQSKLSCGEANLKAKWAELKAQEAIVKQASADLVTGQGALKADQAALKQRQQQTAAETSTQVKAAEARDFKLTNAEAALQLDQADFKDKIVKLTQDEAAVKADRADLEAREAKTKAASALMAKEMADLQKQQAESTAEAEQSAKEVDILRKRCSKLEEQIKELSSGSPRGDAVSQPAAAYDSPPSLQVATDGASATSKVSPVTPAAGPQALPTAAKGTESVADGASQLTASNTVSPINSAPTEGSETGTMPMLKRKAPAKAKVFKPQCLPVTWEQIGSRTILVPVVAQPQRTAEAGGQSQQPGHDQHDSVPRKAAEQPTAASSQDLNDNSLQASAAEESASSPTLPVDSVAQLQITSSGPAPILLDTPIGSTPSAATGTAAKNGSAEHQIATSHVVNLPPGLAHRLSIAGPSAAASTAAPAAQTASTLQQRLPAALAARLSVGQAQRLDGDNSSLVATSSLTATSAHSSLAGQYQVPATLAHRLSFGQSQASKGQISSSSAADGSGIPAVHRAAEERQLPDVAQVLPVDLVSRLGGQSDSCKTERGRRAGAAHNYRKTQVSTGQQAAASGKEQGAHQQAAPGQMNSGAGSWSCTHRLGLFDSSSQHSGTSRQGMRDAEASCDAASSIGGQQYNSDSLQSGSKGFDIRGDGLEYGGSGLDFRGSGSAPSGHGMVHSGSGQGIRGLGLEHRGSGADYSGDGLELGGSGLDYSGSGAGSSSDSWSPRYDGRSSGGDPTGMRRHASVIRQQQGDGSDLGWDYTHGGTELRRHTDAIWQQRGLDVKCEGAKASEARQAYPPGLARTHIDGNNGPEPVSRQVAGPSRWGQGGLPAQKHSQADLRFLSEAKSIGGEQAGHGVDGRTQQRQVFVAEAHPNGSPQRAVLQPLPNGLGLAIRHCPPGFRRGEKGGQNRLFQGVFKDTPQRRHIG